MTRPRTLVDLTAEQVSVLLALWAVRQRKSPVTVEDLRRSGLFPTMKPTAMSMHLRGLINAGLVSTGWTWKTNSQGRQERCHTYALTPAGERRCQRTFSPQEACG